MVRALCAAQCNENAPFFPHTLCPHPPCPPCLGCKDFWDDWAPLKAHLTVAEQFEAFFAAADGNPAATYPDLDMLPIGDVMHQGVLRPSGFTPSEAQLLITLWSFCGAPLIMGGDLPPSSPATLALLTNERILRVHGAARGRRVLHAAAASGSSDIHAWGAAPAEAPAEAYVALINAADGPAAQNVTLPLASLPWLPAGSAVCAVDLWSGNAAGRFAAGAFHALIEPHAAGAFRLAAC